MAPKRRSSKGRPKRRSSTTKRAKRRSSTKRRSSGPRQYRECPTTENLPLNWFRELALRKKGEPKRQRGEVQELYKGFGVTGCDSFKNEALPCKYIPRPKLGAYAAQCGIKGRSYMPRQNLCRSLARRNDLRPFSKSCVNQRLLDLITMTDRHLDTLPISALRRILKAGGIEVHIKNANKAQLKDLIMANQSVIRQVLGSEAQGGPALLRLT